MSNWRRHAACLSEADWWPLRESRTARPYVDERAAMAVCRGCPVLDECRAFAADVRPVVGVWAGTVWRMSNSGAAGAGVPLDREAASA